MSQKHAPHLRTFARAMRHADNPFEQRLWTLLRGRRFLGYRFRRQVPLGPYIADFVCYGRRLIIELDGSQHSEMQEADLQRDAVLRQQHGHRVLRIWNNELTTNEAGVLETVLAALQDSSGITDSPPHPPVGHLLPRRGEGDGSGTSVQGE